MIVLVLQVSDLLILTNLTQGLKWDSMG